MRAHFKTARIFAGERRPFAPLPRYSVGEGRGEGACGVGVGSKAAEERVREHSDSTRTLTLTLSHGVPRERGPDAAIQSNWPSPCLINPAAALRARLIGRGRRVGAVSIAPDLRCRSRSLPLGHIMTRLHCRHLGLRGRQHFFACANIRTCSGKHWTYGVVSVRSIVRPVSASPALGRTIWRRLAIRWMPLSTGKSGMLNEKSSVYAAVLGPMP